MQKQDKEIRETVSLEQARKDLQKIVGLPVALTWKGYGSAIFLELGELHKEFRGWVGKNDGKDYSLKGDWTLCSDGGWVILKDNKMLVDGLEVERGKIEQIIDQFDNAKITAVALADDLSSARVTFDTGTILQLNNESFGFFSLSYNHPPYLVFDEEGSIYYEHNQL